MMKERVTRASRPARWRSFAALALSLAVAAPAGAAEIQLPEYTRTTLKNGLIVFVMPTHRLPLVDFRLVAAAGSVRDPAGKEGVASLTAELLTQGAGKRDARQIAEQIAFIGGTLGASAAAEQLVVSCEVLKKDFATGLELFRDVIVSPTFPAEEFQRKKDESLGEIAAEKDDPDAVADRSLLPFLMGSSPLAHPPIGWQESVAKIERGDIVGFKNEYLTPDYAALAVVGDVEPKRVVAALEKAFADWQPSGKTRGDGYTPLARTAGRHLVVVSKPEVTQTQIRLACPAVPRNHPDFYAITVANTILGSGFTSRLVNEIRVAQGLTYSIGSSFDMYRLTGTFDVSTFTKNETIRKCIDETIKVMRNLKTTGPTDDELAKAKRYLTGQFPLSLQAPDALAARLLNIEFYGLDPKYVETFSSRINAVTMADVRRVLDQHFCVDDLRILVVSNPPVATKALKGLGPVGVQDIR